MRLGSSKKTTPCRRRLTTAAQSFERDLAERIALAALRGRVDARNVRSGADIENPPGKGRAGALSTRPYRCPRRVPGNASAENVVTTAQQPMDVDSGVTAMISVPPVGRS